MKSILWFSLLAGFLVGCSSLRVTTDFAEGTDFSAFRTFQYQESTNSLAVSSPLSHQRIVNAIRGGMVSSGLSEVQENPDVFVTYHGSVDQQTHFHTTYSGVNNWNGHWNGSRRNSRGMGFGVASSTTRPTTVTQGTLVIDVWDATRNAMVWRSVATSALSSNPERSTRTIHDAVERAFRQFPPI
jgi:hypothetical protein